MFTRLTIGMAVASLTFLSTGAFAQETPPVEIGAGYGGFLIVNKGGDYTVGGTRPAFHFGLTLPFKPRFAFEALMTVSTSTVPTKLDVTEGVYILQVKQRFLSRERFHAFVTYGGAGYYARFHQNAYSVTYPTGFTFDTPEARFAQTDPPFFAVIGGGFQREIGGHTALRVDAQLLTLLWATAGVRLSAGIAIPFADYSDSMTRIVR
jgi:hypothetical protein